MVLNPHGIGPTFLKLDSWSLVMGFSYYNHKIILSEKGRKNVRKKIVSCIQKDLTNFQKMGSIPCWIKFHSYLLEITLD